MKKLCLNFTQTNDPLFSSLLKILKIFSIKVVLHHLENEEKNY